MPSMVNALNDGHGAALDNKNDDNDVRVNGDDANPKLCTLSCPCPRFGRHMQITRDRKTTHVEAFPKNLVIWLKGLIQTACSFRRLDSVPAYPTSTAERLVDWE